MSSRQGGATLIELVITIVIISVVLTGVLVGMNNLTARSADPMISAQAVAIAEAYMEEALGQPFSDPESATGSCDSGTIKAGSEEGTNRDLYDDVADYNGLSGTASLVASGASLSGYHVTVTVTCEPLGSGATQVPSTDAVRVQVKVSHAASGQEVVLNGYRTSYF